MQVFVSFTGKDREAKNRVVAELRKGLDPDDSVWESDEGCESDYSRESIAEIRASQVFIVLLSEHSMAPTSYVISEVIEARQCEMRGQLNIMVYQLDKAPMPENFTFQINHVSVVNWIAESDRDGIQSLVRKTRSLLLHRKMGNPEKPADVLVPELNGIVIGRAGYYVEHSRDSEIMKLRTAFEESNILFCIQLEGYGRRTAVRKYAEIFAESYSRAVYFPQFSGTLWDFFLNGLEIENINSSVFEGLSEFDKIKKKIQLLEKLTGDTLLLVPNVMIDERDYGTLLEMIMHLQCRFIIITQSVPRSISSLAPVVQVGRMPDEYLLELFFHYYDHADEDERRELTPALLDFFGAVGGHTKTIELTASIFSEEYVMPDEMPGKLEEVSRFSSDELSERIYQSVCSLFNIMQFDETDRKIMLCAALMAETPIPEDDFTDMLKKAKLFSGASLKKLCNRRWIDRDSDARTLNMNRLLCMVCRSRLPLYEDVLCACFRGAYNICVDHGLEWKNGLIRLDVLRIKQLWDMLEARESTRVAQYMVYLLDDSREAGMQPGELEEVIHKAGREQKDLPEAYREASLCAFEFIVDMVRVLCISELYPKTAGPSGAWEDSLVEQFLELMTGSDREGFVRELLETGEEDDPETRKIAAGLRQMFSSRSIHQLVGYYFTFAEAVVRYAEKKPDSDEMYMTVFITIAIGNCILRFSDSSYTRLMVYRAQEQMVEFSGVWSEAQLHQLYINKAKALMELGEYTEELDEAYEEAMRWFKKAWADVYKDEQEAEEVRLSLAGEYAGALAETGRPQKAAEICRACLKSRIWTTDMLCTLTSMMSATANALFKAGETGAACTFMHDTILPAQDIASGLTDRDERYTDALNDLDTLREILDAVENTRIRTDEQDNPEAYMDYYRSFSLEGGNRRRMEAYMSIAEKASKISLQELTDEELAELRGKLHSRAMNDERWERLAPEAFALFSETGKRTLGYYMHYVQFIGSAIIFDGGIAEMQNGEGKTYTIALAAFMHTLYSRRTHILDTSDYLSRRNFTWMRGLLERLGCRVGLVAKTNRHSELIADCDILYGKLSEVLFLKMRWMGRGWHEFRKPLRWDALIVDEADEGMVEYAGEIALVADNKTEPDGRMAAYCYAALSVVQELKRDDDEFFSYKKGRITLKMPILERMEDRLGQRLAELGAENQAAVEMTLRTAICVLLYDEKGKDYFVTRDRRGKEAICFETAHGKLEPVRNEYAFFAWAREGRMDKCRTMRLEESRELQKRSILSLLKEYDVIGGASATVSSMEQEFRQYYGLQVYRVAPNRPVKRKDHNPAVFPSVASKEKAVADLVEKSHQTGQPVLVICGNVAESVRISQLLRRREMEPVLFNAVNQDEDPDCLQYAGEIGRITVTTAIANRGVDICLGGDPSVYAKNQLLRSGVDLQTLNRAIYGMNSMDQETLALRKRYTELCAYYWYSFSDAKEEAERLGGLCVIGTTCFDDLRIEQQVRGRSGRQGCAGESYMFYSIEDQTLSVLLGDRVEMCQRLMNEEQFTDMAVLHNAIRRARLRVQHGKSRGRMETWAVEYYDEAEKRLFSAVPVVSAPDVDLMGFLKKQFQEDPRYLEDLNALKGNGIPRQDSLIRYLSENGMSIQDRQRPAQKAEQICGFITELVRTARREKTSPNADIPEEDQIRWPLAEKLIDGFNNASMRYLELMKAEIHSSSIMIKSPSRRNRHLKDYSLRQVNRLYNECIEKAVLQFLQDCCE